MERSESPKPKVCHITTVHDPFDTRIFTKQARTLRQEGFAVVLIARHARDETVDGIRIAALPQPRNRLFRLAGLPLKAMRLATREKAALYHFHDPELIPAGLLLKLLTRKKVVYDVHEDYPQYMLIKHWIPRWLRWCAAFLINLAEKMAAFFLDAVIPVTDEIEKRFAGARAQVIQVRNYPLFDLPYRKPDRGETTDSMGEPSQTLENGETGATLQPGTDQKPGKAGMPGETGEPGEAVLVFVGLMSRLRGLVELVQAVELMRPQRRFRLKLVGRFEEAALEEELRAMAGFSRVELHGWADRRQVWEHLLTSDAGCVLFHPVPNHTEALPNKLFEYLSAGLPVIASDFPLWKEIVEGNRCGLTVNPLDPAEIARAAERLLDDPTLRAEMGANARRAVMEKYCWDREGEKLTSLYRRLLM